MSKPYDEQLDSFIRIAVSEDLGEGDHSALASIPAGAQGQAKLIVKDEGILAGIETGRKIFAYIDAGLSLEILLPDGSKISRGDIAFTLHGDIHSILMGERLVLNIMQRMSGIATQTRQYVDKLQGLSTRILDTRKTSPGIRFLEKEAVRIGGGLNHRMGLYDMIMLKDNHIDYAGGIEKAIRQTHAYLKKEQKDLSIVVEARNLADVQKIIETGGVLRILLDNFTVEDTRKAVELIDHRYETESSGGITLDTIRNYAGCGVDFISVGALTHQIKSLDMSLKAIH